jgi:hypothetical protein
MVNQSKKNDPRYWKKWKESGAIGDIKGRDYGKAYGFLYYAGRTKHISEVLPQIREGTETPSKLKLKVENIENFDSHGDSQLTKILEQAKSSHMSHVIEATMPDMKNLRAANYLGNVMNGIYSELYSQSEPFNAGIVYKRGDKYVFRRD